MLDLAFGLTETSRLGCQIAYDADELDGLVVKLPAGTRNPLNDWTPPCASWSPMSGGVDSSTVGPGCCIEAGHEVIGHHLAASTTMARRPDARAPAAPGRISTTRAGWPTGSASRIT